MKDKYAQFFFFFNRVTDLCERNNIFSEWLMSPFKETYDQCTSLTYFCRYNSGLMLMNKAGHIVNAIKLETVLLNLVYCY